MKIIDAHMHFSDIQSFRETTVLSSVDYSRDGFTKECRENGIEAALCMGVTEGSKYSFPDVNAATPMKADLCADMPEGMYLCLGINPHRLDSESLHRLEATLKSDKCVGIKLYAGYYHVDINDNVYHPVYELAQKYSLPVVIHTGDTFSERGLLAYSHPLNIDKLAVNNRDVVFVMAHMGDPWILDACEITYKNRNVYMDLSGLIVGGAEEFERVEGSDLLMNRFKTGLELLNDYKKLLFGTDWPLAPMKEYISFCKKLIPKNRYEDVFYNNALEVFGRLNIEGGFK